MNKDEGEQSVVERLGEDDDFFKDLSIQLTFAWESMDLSKVAKFFSKESDLMFFDAAPLKYIGWEKYEKTSLENFTYRFTHQKFKIYDDMIVRRSGNLAVTAFTLHLDVTKTDGEKIDTDGRVTYVWEKQGDQWLIVHEHVSLPQVLPPIS